MRPVSAQFLDALGSPHKVCTTITATTPLGDEITLKPLGGRVVCDTASIRRRSANITAEATPAEVRLITTPGTLFRIDHGIDYRHGDPELVPVFHGELADPDEPLASGSISLAFLDDTARLARCPFVTPYVPFAGITRAIAIRDIVLAASPLTAMIITATDTGTVGAQMFTGSRLSAIEKLATDGNIEAFFDPTGTFIIRDAPSTSTPPVWTIKAGRGGTLMKANRRRPLTKLINSVQVRPSGTSGSQVWKPQTATITDIANPLHPNYIGLATFIIDSPSIDSTASAVDIAYKNLARRASIPVSLSLAALSNPALEGNDVIGIQTAAAGQNEALGFQHWIDAFDIDLKAGSMNVVTREQVSIDG